MFYCIIIIIVVVVVVVAVIIIIIIIIIIIVIIEKSFTDFLELCLSKANKQANTNRWEKNFLKYKKACLHS